MLVFMVIVGMWWWFWLCVTCGYVFDNGGVCCDGSHGVCSNGSGDGRVYGDGYGDGWVCSDSSGDGRVYGDGYGGGEERSYSLHIGLSIARP